MIRSGSYRYLYDGTTWQLTSGVVDNFAGIQNSEYQIAEDEANSTIIYLGCHSTDGGATFATHYNSSTFAPSDIRGAAFAGGNWIELRQDSGKKVWRSTDAINWTFVTTLNSSNIDRVSPVRGWWYLMEERVRPSDSSDPTKYESTGTTEPNYGSVIG
jgi:hypothetical protein